ncbi:hypothetical protein GmHk_07G018741 [Glycine max]|nr:hypothetical protein GmHk_07G018741 [Glycine max]
MKTLSPNPAKGGQKQRLPPFPLGYSSSPLPIDMFHFPFVLFSRRLHRANYLAPPPLTHSPSFSSTPSTSCGAPTSALAKS